MGFLAVFDKAVPVPVVVRSDQPTAEVIARLTRAVQERRYSEPGRFSPGFFRLDGTIHGTAITVGARRYVIPGVPAGYALRVELQGSVVPSGSGSEIRGILSAPTDQSFWLRWWGWTVIFAAIVLVISGPILISSPALVLFAVWFAVASAFAPRLYQRRALGNSGEIARILSLIVNDPPKPQPIR